MTSHTDRKDEVGEFDDVITDLKWLVSLGQRARTSDVAQLHRAISALLAHDSLLKERDELKREVERLQVAIGKERDEVERSRRPGDAAAEDKRAWGEVYLAIDSIPGDDGGDLDCAIGDARAAVEILEDIIKARAEKAEAEAKELREELERAKDSLADMVNQFAYPCERKDGFFLSTGGLSALELAFDVLGYDDPKPCPERKCQTDGCFKEGSCGTPGPDGYKWLCGKHADAYRARMEQGKKEQSAGGGK